MKMIAAMFFVLSCVVGASQAPAQEPIRLTESAADWFSDFGFEKLPELVQWIRRLDTEWEKLVQQEERTQLLRQLKKIASTTAELELDCIAAVALLRTGADVIPEIDALEKTVAELRKQMTRLSTDLGGDIGKDGLSIARQFENFMLVRSGYLSEAHNRLLRNRPDDRAAAAEYLTNAAKLARAAREALVLFIKERAAQG